MIRTVCTALLLAMLAPSVLADTPRVFLYVRDGSRDLDRMLVQEVGVMQQMLEDAGYRVDIATPGDRPLVTDARSLEPGVKLADVDIADYAGLVLPCMAPARGFDMPERVDKLVAEAIELGLPVAASRGSVESLANAGALVGRKYAYAGPVSVAERPEFRGGSFVGTGVVRDGSVSTAGICPLAARSTGEPDGTFELMNAFIASLDERS